jgi:hypothetical protein
LGNTSCFQRCGSFKGKKEPGKSEKHVREFLFLGKKRENRSHELSSEEKHVFKTLGWREILDTLRALDIAYLYLRKRQSRPKSVSAINHLKYHFEHYLHEYYILYLRLDTFIKVVERSYKKESLQKQKTTQLLKELVAKENDHMVKVRGRHVHQTRYDDEDIIRLNALHELSQQDDGFANLLSVEYQVLQRQKLELMGRKTKAANKLVQLYFKAVFPILVDPKTKNLRIPAK